MMYSEQDAIDEIRRIATSELGMTRDVRSTDRLVEDLGLDSMALITLAVALEDHFNILLTDEDVMRVDTVAELARHIVHRTTAHLEDMS